MDPVYIANNWTPELLSLMAEKLAERKRKEAEAIKSIGNSDKGGVPEYELFNKGKNLIKVEKKNAD